MFTSPHGRGEAAGRGEQRRAVARILSLSSSPQSRKYLLLVRHATMFVVLRDQQGEQFCLLAIELAYTPPRQSPEEPRADKLSTGTIALYFIGDNNFIQ